MSIYIHIPFCNKKCTYCDFHFSTRYKSYYLDMIDALCLELDLKKDRIKKKIESIYFGGGTPGILNITDLKKLIEKCKKNFDLIDDIEITLEVNPENISEQKLKEWKLLGVNRLSIGVQSFDNNVLNWMNRTHNSNDSLNSIYLANKVGFDNINIDLIFAIPNSDNNYWKKQLSILHDLPIKHISAYQLTVERKTLLSYQANNNQIKILDDKKSANQFIYTYNFLKKLGFEHYEISNYAKDNRYSKHNLSYWNGKDYLGIGPSAHSFQFPFRYWNISNNKKYIENIKNNIILEEKEQLSIQNIFNEKIMLGLRTKYGVNLKELNEILNFSEEFINNVKNYVDKKLLNIDNNRLILTNKGKLFADKITSELFCV